MRDLLHKHFAFACDKCKHVTTCPNEVSHCERCGSSIGEHFPYYPNAEAKQADLRRHPIRTDDGRTIRRIDPNDN